MKSLKPRRAFAMLPLLVTALTLACCSRGDSPMSAEAFLKELKNNKDAAYEKYKDKDILLTGKASAAKEYEDGRIILGLVGGAGVDDNILCEYEGTSPQIRDALLKVRDGERIEVQGRLFSFLALSPITMVTLENCQLRR